MENIPVIKLGLVAVSRDCFPIALSEKRRAAIAAKLADRKVNFVEIKTTVENEKTCCKTREKQVQYHADLIYCIKRLT